MFHLLLLQEVNLTACTEGIDSVRFTVGKIRLCTAIPAATEKRINGDYNNMKFGILTDLIVQIVKQSVQCLGDPLFLNWGGLFFSLSCQNLFSKNM